MVLAGGTRDGNLAWSCGSPGTQGAVLSRLDVPGQAWEQRRDPPRPGCTETRSGPGPPEAPPAALSSQAQSVAAD